MTYGLEVRILALAMVNEHGIVKTSRFTKIGRTSIWRWKTKGINKKTRNYVSPLFEQSKYLLKEFLLNNKTTTADRISKHLKESLKIKISRKSILRFINKIRFSRKRTRRRGICKGNYEERKKQFRTTYINAVNENKLIVTIDEAGCCEKTMSEYGYSEIGTPCIVMGNGSWINHSLLMATTSLGEKEYLIKTGAINRTDVEYFIDSLSLNKDAIIILDNASIHKNLQLRTDPTICYTPPYTPEYNAIELCFGIIKNKFKTENTISNINVRTTLNDCTMALTNEAIVNCFDHVYNNFINN